MPCGVCMYVRMRRISQGVCTTTVLLLPLRSLVVSVIRAVEYICCMYRLTFMYCVTECNVYMPQRNEVVLRCYCVQMHYWGIWHHSLLLYLLYDRLMGFHRDTCTHSMYTASFLISSLHHTHTKLICNVKHSLFDFLAPRISSRSYSVGHHSFVWVNLHTFPFLLTGLRYISSLYTYIVSVTVLQKALLSCTHPYLVLSATYVS